MPVTNTRRMVTTGGLEWRSDSTGTTLEGHASTFNQPYDMGWYTETVAPGAFTRTLNAKPDCRLLINHSGLPLARTVSGTLQLAQDDSGLYMRSVLDPNDPDVQRIMPKIQRGDLNEMSFGFGAVKDKWSDDFSQRTLQELSLANGDVSVVTYAANPNATFTMRSRIFDTVGPEKLRAMYSDIIAAGNKTEFSDATVAQLAVMLESICVADELLDSSFVTLSKLLGVANPDDDDEPASEDMGDMADMGEMEMGRAAVTNLETARIARTLRAARIRLELLRH